MKQEKIQMFLMNNQKNFEASQMPLIAEKLQNADDESLMIITSAKYKDPTTMLIISLFLGGLGVDRFMLGDIGIGVLKLLTFGCFGILTIIDWFTVMDKTRRNNYDIFMEAVDAKHRFSTDVSSLENNQTNNIEEIKKFKELLDSGIITQEEFDRKKRELL